MIKIIGSNFTKLSAEKFKENLGKSENMKISTTMDISYIEPLKSDFLRIKEDILKIGFIYIISYEPGFAKIEINGDIIISAESKTSKEILKGWKDKLTSEDFKIFIFNAILRKSNIRSLQLEEEIGVPTHLPMPVLNKAAENKEDKK